MKKSMNKMMTMAVLGSICAGSLGVSPMRAYAEDGPQAQEPTTQVGDPYALTPQGVIIELGLKVIASIAGQSFVHAVFPNSEIDYKRIKKDMEEATRKSITDAMLDEKLGRINGYALVAKEQLNTSDPVTELYRTWAALIVDNSSIHSGQFEIPGFGNYVLGGQTEVSILTAMLKKSPEKSLIAGTSMEGGTLETVDAALCDRDCVIATMHDRIDFLLDATQSTLEKIEAERYNQRLGEISPVLFDGLHCIFSDNGTQIQWTTSSEAACKNWHSSYAAEAAGAAVVKVHKDLKWTYQARANWATALSKLVGRSEADLIRARALKELSVSYLANPTEGNCRFVIYQALTNTANGLTCNLFSEAVKKAIGTGGCAKPSTEKPADPVTGLQGVYLEMAQYAGCAEIPKQ